VALVAGATGLVGREVLAALLADIGDRLGIQLYLAAIFAFGNRIFLNFGVLRRHLVQKKED
jgi:small basic protein